MHPPRRLRPRYGQVVCGPPGSGKTTFCDGMQQYLRLLGRKPAVINLDPANEYGNTSAKSDTQDTTILLPYETAYDICRQAINLSSVMERTGLGPNGGLLYCMEYIETHKMEILKDIAASLDDDSYVIIDLPGQIELYTHSTCVQDLLASLTTHFDLRLTGVQLVDALYCESATKFIASAVLATSTMLRLELPFVSVLSKLDLLCIQPAMDDSTETNHNLPLPFEFFTDCHDLDRLVPFLNNEKVPSWDNNDDTYEYNAILEQDLEYQMIRQKRAQSTFSSRHMKLHAALAEIVEDFGLLSYIPLDVNSAESMGGVLARIDKANGYVFTENSVNQDLFQCAIVAASNRDSNADAIADVRERIASPELIPELRCSHSRVNDIIIPVRKNHHHHNDPVL